jgi:hypothetical protein
MKIRTGRLLRIAKFLETKVQRREDRRLKAGKDHAFYMGAWCFGTPAKPNCGFIACAIGWVLQDKLIPGFVWGKPDLYQSIQPAYEKAHNWQAVMAALGLTMKRAEHLFSYSAYETSPQPRDVAKRIREFVAAN